jgi:hypothetical protein
MEILNTSLNFFYVRVKVHRNKGPGWNLDPSWSEPSSILVLLESFLQTCMTYTIAECTVNKLLMMDRGTVRNM